MAFPVSPADGQIYKNYKYNSTLGAWEIVPFSDNGNLVLEPENGNRIIFDEDGETPAGVLRQTTYEGDWLIYGVAATTTTQTIDLSAIVPADTKTVEMFSLLNSQTGGTYLLVDNVNPVSTSNFGRKTAVHNDNGGHGSRFLVDLDSGRKFYWRTWDGGSGAGTGYIFMTFVRYIK